MDQAQTLRDKIGSRRTETAPRVISLVSGKGGVGKTNFAANLAVLAAKQGQRVLIVDADLGLANVEILYGITPRYHIGNLLDGTCSPSGALAHGPHGIRILPAGSGLKSLTRLDAAQKLRLVAAIDTFDNDFDLILIDSGAGIGDNVMFFAGATQEAILVVNPEPTSLSDGYAAIKVLSLDAHVEHFGVVVNQAATETMAHQIFQRLGAVAGRFLNAKLRYLGFSPRDENIHRAVMAQQPVVDLYPLSPASRAMAHIAHNLFSERPPIQLDGGLKFLWHRFFREDTAAGA